MADLRPGDHAAAIGGNLGVALFCATFLAAAGGDEPAIVEVATGRDGERGVVMVMLRIGGIQFALDRDHLAMLADVATRLRMPVELIGKIENDLRLLLEPLN